MLIERTAVEPTLPQQAVDLCKSCMGCENCSGSCYEMIQLFRLPSGALAGRDARS